jgi:hypothetical protein
MMPRFKHVREGDLDFVFECDVDDPSILHIYARHLTTVQQAIAPGSMRMLTRPGTRAASDSRHAAKRTRSTGSGWRKTVACSSSVSRGRWKNHDPHRATADDAHLDL